MKYTPVVGSPTASTNSEVRLVEVSNDTFQAPLVISVHGNQGSGKSRLVASAKGKIGVIPLEHKSRSTIINCAREFGKTLVLPDIDLIRTGRPMDLDALPPGCVMEKEPSKDGLILPNYTVLSRMGKAIKLTDKQPTCCQIHYYRWHANRTKSVAYREYDHPGVKTLAFDTFGQFVEDLLYANYGRVENIIPLEKKVFNQEVRDFINAIADKNLIFTHHSAQIWQDNKPTSKWKPMSAFSKLGHYTSVEVRQWRTRDLSDGDFIRLKKQGIDPGEITYGLTVLDCQANPELIGQDLLFDEDITFANLAMRVYPDGDPEQWMD